MLWARNNDLWPLPNVKGQEIYVDYIHTPTSLESDPSP